MSEQQLDDFPEVLLTEPVAPEEWECCGSECGDYCVYEIYARERQAYQEQQRRIQAWISSNK